MALSSKFFESIASNTFRQLWDNQDFAEVTLATVNHQHIRAHKVILSSCSSFFRNIFINNANQDPLLYLKGIAYKELKLVLQYIYLGHCEVGQDDLSLFLETGKDLEVSGLIEEIRTDVVTEDKEEDSANMADSVQENINMVPRELTQSKF